MSLKNLLKKILFIPYKKEINYIKNNIISLQEYIRFNNKKNILEQNILYSTESGITKEKYCNHDFIVSLTTYSKRLHEVHLAIESIMEQTMKPNKIILWLDNSYKNITLPKALQLQQKRGLEIHFCEDIRSYKKLIPTLSLYPNDAIITIDDDLIYEFDLLENLIIPYLSDPSYIYCHRQHRMKFNEEGTLLPYIKWEWNCKDTEPNITNFPTTGGGTLFPPNSLDKEVFNKEIFMDICKFADDVWFKAMAIKKGTLSKKVFSHNEKGDEYIAIPNVQDMGLYNINVLGDSLNDKQIELVFKKYNLYNCFQ